MTIPLTPLVECCCAETVTKKGRAPIICRPHLEELRKVLVQEYVRAVETVVDARASRRRSS